MKRYSDLVRLPTYEERIEYCRLDGEVGSETLGVDRYLCQEFYKSAAWRALRNKIIARDCGCDLAVPGFCIKGTISVHHLNPVSAYDFMAMGERLMDPENLVCVSHGTHNLIHYGRTKVEEEWHERTPNDTCPWLVWH